MARITVEDCLQEQNNRFELTLLAAKRARHLVMSGQEPLVPWENDKPTVVALREIAEGLITPEVIEQQEMSRHTDPMVDAQDMLAQAASSIAQVDAKEMVIEVSETQEDEIVVEVEAPVVEAQAFEVEVEASEPEAAEPEIEVEAAPEPEADAEIKPELPEDE